MLSIGGHLEFDAPPQRFLGRAELLTAAQDRRHEARRRCPGPMRQELCLSSPKSSFLPSSLQRWAEADSLLHRVCGRDSTFQPLPLCLALTKDQLNLALTVGRLRRCADSVCDALTRQGTIQMMHPSARPVYPRPHRTTPRNSAAPAHAVPFPLPAVPKWP